MIWIFGFVTGMLLPMPDWWWVMGLLMAALYEMGE